MKIKNKNLRKYKNKKFIFFKKKFGARNKKPQKSAGNRINPEIPNILTKIYHFLIDFHSLTPAGVSFPLEQSLILLERIRASGRLSNNKSRWKMFFTDHFSPWEKHF